jgi:hypothetical protein
MEQTAWLAQCLCPERQPIGPASTSDMSLDPSGERVIAHLRGIVTAMIGEGTIEPYCLSCHAPAQDWLFEVRSVTQ